MMRLNSLLKIMVNLITTEHGSDYSHIVFDSNIWFTRLNDISVTYKKHIEEVKRELTESI